MMSKIMLRHHGHLSSTPYCLLIPDIPSKKYTLKNQCLSLRTLFTHLLSNHLSVDLLLLSSRVWRLGYKFSHYAFMTV